MQFILDEHGTSVKDCDIHSLCDEAIKNQSNIHVANALVFDVFRSKIKSIPLENRPNVKWFIYGKEISVDKNMKSWDAWKDERMNIAEKALFKLI